MAMFISDEDHCPHRSIYFINFFDTEITVTVTSHAATAADWLRTTLSLRRNYRRRLVVGVGVQWNPFYRGYPPAHTLQLCIGARCLIFQLAVADSVPPLLRNFLLDSDVTFVGLWNHSDARRLMASEHRLEVHELLDLRYFVETDDGESLVRASVEEIVEECLGFEGVRIDREISMSDWDAEVLSDDQVLQAAIDAHVSFLIGRNYRVWELRD